jgi:hypothetical protein
LLPTNPHWARVVGYGPFFLWEIHKEGLKPSSGDINMMIIVAVEQKNSTLSSIIHHQPINVPTAGEQAFLMDYT